MSRLSAAITMIANTLLLTSCAPNQPIRVSDGLVVGSWGGQHIALALSDSGGTVEYDCAHGAIREPVRTQDGAFQAQGIHLRDHGGPVRIDELIDSVPTLYIGHVDGNQMTLRVFAGADTLGPFELGRDQSPLLLRCL